MRTVRSERRRDVRVPLIERVRFRAAGMRFFGTGRILNIGKKGLLLATRQTLAVGTPLHIEMPGRGPDEYIQLRALVVRVAARGSARRLVTTTRNQFGCSITGVDDASSDDEMARSGSAYPEPETTPMEVVDLSQQVDPLADDWVERALSLTEIGTKTAFDWRLSERRRIDRRFISLPWIGVERRHGERRRSPSPSVDDDST